MDRSRIELETPESLDTRETPNPEDVMRFKLEGSNLSVKQEIMDVVMKPETDEDLDLMEEGEVRGEIQNSEEHIFEGSMNWMDNLKETLQLQAQNIVKNVMSEARPQDAVVSSERIDGSSDDEQMPVSGRIHERQVPSWTSTVTTSDGGIVNNESFSLTSGGKLNQINKKITGSMSAQPLICPVCGLDFQTKSGLTTHQKVHIGATAYKPYACTLCDHRSGTRQNLQRHLKTHTKENHVCTTCDQSFENLYHLTVHQKTHTAGKPYTCPPVNTLERKTFSCQICSKTFNQPTLLHNHMISHRNMQLFPCPDCDKVFPSESSLKVHSSKHTRESLYTTYTIKTLPSKQALQVHHATHTGKKPHGGTTSGKSFTSPQQHQKKPLTGKKPLGRTTSGKSFTSPQQHQKKPLTGKKPLGRTTSGESFTTPQQHQKKPLTGQKPLGRTTSGESFTSPQQQGHKKPRTEKIPFGCTTCDKSFKNQSSLNAHQKTHKDKKPYACSKCDRSFDTQQFLQRHQRAHTGKKS